MFVANVTYNFQMAAILVLLITWYYVQIGSHRNFIFDMNMHICLEYIVITF